MARLDLIENERFSPAALRVDDRRAGIAAFMRVRNGGQFLDAVVRSHVPFYDEIVICINQCTDDSEAIVETLMDEFPDTVKGYHYVDRVLPLGHPDNATLAFDDPSSMANYCSCALARTTCTVATKLDDDHICIPNETRRVTASIRDQGCRLPGEMLCFSGLNLVANDTGLGVLHRDPFSGQGDIGYFQVGTNTYFVNTARFERMQRPGLRRRHVGLAYLHVKHLKAGRGFDNYELDALPDSRFARMRDRFDHDHESCTIGQLAASQRRLAAMAPMAFALPEKLRLKVERAVLMHGALTDPDLEALIATCGDGVATP
ncbi:MAG: hypothetical protein MK074_08625 [Phycisphaerales bacterium]|nr:hypothetical protein [Phycisphaerales bacterium]